MPMLSECRSVAIWGFGREGRAALDFIRHRYPDIRLTILNDTALPAGLPDGVGVVTGDDIPAALRSGAFDLVVKSPGVSLYRPEIAEAKAAGAAFTSVTDLWFAFHGPTTTIAVTGTKGKSTTARLIHHMLISAGVDATLLGNVGTPALGAPAARYTVLELSSYQIADLDHAPDLAVVTNLYPEHAPWHGSVERYYRDKLRLLDLSESTRGICNGADPELRPRLAGRAGIAWFNTPEGFRAEDGRLTRRGDSIDCAGFPLKGDHNLSNLAAACTVLEAIGLDAVAAVGRLGDFVQLPHRLQETTLPGDILCVNDSISTVPEATIAALATYPGRDTVLLLGGTERGQDYARLYDVLEQRGLSGLMLLPATGIRIHRELAGRNMPFEIVPTQNLADAVTRGLRLLKPGSLLLLSPAAPSFGEFANFEERGKAFEALCRAGIGSPNE